MKIFLQDQITRLFAKASGLWVTNAGEATDFITSRDAMNFGYLHRLSNTVLVIWTDGRHFEMPLRCDEF